MRALGARAGVIVSVAAIVVGVMATTGSAANTAGLVHITARSGPSGRRKDAPATTVPSSTPPSSTTTTTSSTLPTTSATTTASPSPRRPVQTAGGVSGQSITCDTSWIVGNGSGDWTNAADWSSGVPDSTKNACLPAGSYTVSIAQESVQAKALDVAAGVTLSPQIVGCSPSDAVLTLSGNMTNAGTVDLANPGDAC